MIVHCAKSMCFVRSIYLHVSAVFITKQKSLGWSKTSKRKRTFEFVESIGRKDQLNIHRLIWFEFVSIVGSKSVALCFGFYGAQVRLHMNFQTHNHMINPVTYATSQSLTLSPVMIFTAKKKKPITHMQLFRSRHLGENQRN